MKPDRRSDRRADNARDRRENRGADGADGADGRDGERRRNSALAAVVDEGIRFDAERGAALAWAYLSQHGLPPETILRVLSPPADGHLPRRSPSRGMDGTGLRH